MEVFRVIEEAMAHSRPNIGIVRGRSYYPSAAMSVDLLNPSKRIGACVRAEYYRVKRYPETNPTGDYSNYILSYGKVLEQWMIEQLKIAGVYASSNDKFVFPNHPLISGEIDIVVKEPDGTYAVIENKTFNSGNYASLKSLGGAAGRGAKFPYIRPEPKISNLMQSHIYLHALSGISKVYLTYLDRAAGGPQNNIQFNITNHQTDEGNFARVTVKRPWRDEPITYVNEHFTIESIISGYEYLHEHVVASQLPSPTYRISMSDEDIQAGFASGEIAKTKYEAYTRNKEKYPISDWQCGWCRFLNQCKVDQNIEIV